MAFNLLNKQCFVCRSKDKVQVCAACKVVHYCGREHQVADRSDHKDACKSIKKSRQTLDDEERKLRAQPGDMFTPENVFESGVGHFWGIHETRPYMRARFANVEALLKVNTNTAVQAALDDLMDMHRLCRGDNMGVRDLTPHCFLRLGKDQVKQDNSFLFCV